MADGLTAYTAPGEVFASDEELKAHYRTEWHRYNLKRKVANLKPLTKEAFEARQSAAASAAAESGKGKRAARAERQGGRAADKAAPHPKSKAAFYRRAAAMSEEELIDARIASAPKFGPGHDLFSSHVSDSLEANLQHMACTHGFRVPHAEFVRDMAGLLRYLQEKVYIGCTALLDGKQFHSVEAVQAHMRDKGTTRFELEGNEDEFAEFYDLDALANDSPLWVEIELDDDDDDDDGDRASGAAPMDDGAGGAAAEQQSVRTAVVYAPAVGLAAAAAAGASDDAALVVAGGTKELGHRSLRRYYNQRMRPETAEQAMMGRLLLQYRQMGVIAQPQRGGAVGAWRGAAGPGRQNERDRRYQARANKQALSVGLKRNELIKDNQKSQYIVFG